MNTTAQAPAQISLPEILTANTYYWTSGMSADQRRRAEDRRQSQVADFFKAQGFEVSRSGDNVHASGFGIEVEFHYSESCKNVYKTCAIYRNGKKSNISSLRKLFGI